MPYSLEDRVSHFLPSSTTTWKPNASYHYHHVAAILDMQTAKRTVDVYGVILDCRAPCITNGQQLRSEIVIADESCMSPSGTLRTFPIHCFIDDPTDAIPFRDVGDIVRIHRALLIDYTPQGDSPVRQGRVKYYSSVLLWRHDDHHYDPFITKSYNQLRQSHYHSSSPNATHKLDQHDMSRVAALRKWSRNFVLRKYYSQRQYLRIVPEVLSAPQDAVFITKSFDLVCYVQHPQVAAENGTINMLVCYREEQGAEPTNILVTSQEPSQSRENLRSFNFVHFCPSWNFRPNKPSWLLLRDVRIAHRGQQRIIELSVSGRTSTLIWNNANAPDVRAARDKYQEHRENHVTPAITHSATGYSMLHPHPQTTPKRPRTWDANQDYASKQTLLPAADRYPNNAGNTKRRKPSDAQGISEDQTSHAPRDNGPFAQTVAPRAEDRRPEQRTSVPGENSTGIALNPYESLITTHDQQDRKVWRIQDMVRAFRLGCGECKVFRLAVWARGVAWPRDLRLACRPLCKGCEEDVLVLGDKCNKCGSQEQRWQFALRFVLEDRMEGARIESWVKGKEAERFLGFQAADLRNENGKCELLKQRLQQITSPVKVVDCLVIPYEYEDDMGVYRIACAMKGTRCLV
ncbi:hypothetical protein BWQ96_08669 [Gracilariopsis chorda]|uniref:Telomeric single stranded DNA binding POT1/Cdc13 domain-containing protein n=1 Tax=Gracilariopsis chorda TaxID=448386 RepID=A0A2V3IHZ4_9FLOR|nr:hypothetical protein BWQ96_08669 [Gracilariopsis chorda]|eukprot:PXF41658.1 hypothetical protein BWQ96_08669 [Gracilariopsis chorda]